MPAIAMRLVQGILATMAIVLLAIGATGAEPQETAEPPAAKTLVGRWQGTLDAGVKLRVVFNIAESADGELSATLDSPDQGAKGIPIDQVTLEDRTLRLESKAIGGKFEGQLNAVNGEIAGKWQQGGATLALVLKRAAKIEEVKRPQDPMPPFPYDEEDVAYENGAGRVKLAGTLTLPRGGSPHAAVLLITGSGPQDRDESLLGHRPFRVLADYLTRRGIAVLRVDDRGVGGSTGDLNDATSDDLAGDALAGVAFLKARPEIDARKIGLLGHSEGGIIGPLAAVRSSDVAFVVMLAGPGTTGERILYAQGALILKAAGANDDAIAKQRKLQERLFAVIKHQTDNDAASARLTEIVAAERDSLSGEEKKAAAGALVQFEQQRTMLLSAWFRFFLTYDPRPTLEKLTCPTLALIGEHDLQVPPQENLPVIEAALKAGQNSDFRVQMVPGLNHLFQTCKTGSPSEYGQIQETMSPQALSIIGDWIVERVRREEN